VIPIHQAQLNEPAGNQIGLSYVAGNLAMITDTVGRAVALSYDGANRLTQIQDPIGRRVIYGYDAIGRLVTVVDKIGNALGQDPNLHTWRYGYDGSTRRLTSVVDPDGRVSVRNTYDAQGRLAAQRDGLDAT